MSLVVFQDRIGHRFQDQSLLDEALTHSSWAHEHAGADNERLEFLGDAVLNACTTAMLVERFPGASEGVLSRARARLVDERTLAEVGRRLGLGGLLRLGRGEESTGGREKSSLLADATEAVLGALFLEVGFDRCRVVVDGWLADRLGELDQDQAVAGVRWKHPRTLLQEIAQERWSAIPDYRVVERSGPDHAPTYTAEVVVGERLLGRGTAGSKREAYARAAEHAVEALGDDEQSR